MRGDEPEIVYEVIHRLLVHQEKQLGQVDPAMRRAINTVPPMFGMAADRAWSQLPWRKRFRLDREVWKARYTAELREYGRTVMSSDFAHIQALLEELQ